MKKKWWMLGCLALAAISLCFFGVRVRIAPRLILTKALGSALEQVDARFENSPGHLLTAVLDSQGRQQAQLMMETENLHLGTVVYDMELNTQLSPNRVMGTGSVITGGKILDISLFLDETFAAISSQSLVGGNFYGITYDTFAQDIRERPLLAALIGQKTIGRWEDAVASIREKMSLNFSVPDVDPQDIRTALYAALVLKPEISRQEIILDQETCNAYAATVHTTGRELAEIGENYHDRLKPEILRLIDELEKMPGLEIQVTFVLHKGNLVQISGILETKEKYIRILMYLGENPLSSTLSLEAEVREGEDLSRYSLQVMTKSDGENYDEALSFIHTKNGKQAGTILNYQWDLSSGDMDLQICHAGEKVDQRLNLTGEGERFTISAQNIRPLMNFLLDEEKQTPAICTLTVSQGSAVAVPEYRNLDQWSLEDLVSLLEGFGGFLGLNMT